MLKSFLLRVQPGLRNYIRKMVKNGDVAEDLLSNVLVKLWTKIDQYNPEWQITTWLYKIAFNESLAYIKERNQKSSLDNLREFGVQVSDNGSIADVTSLLHEYHQKTEEDFIEEDNEIMTQYGNALQAISDLKPMYKEIMEDRLLKNMKYEDIAQKHKVNLQTVKNRIRRGKMLIAEKI
jgi:RNA polymerase sigma-70 factor (ECF subfamily)